MQAPSYGANRLDLDVGEFVLVGLGTANEEYAPVVAADLHFRPRRYNYRLSGVGEGNAKQHKVIDSASLEKRSGDLSLHRKMPDAPFGCVVVPRNTILIEEAEQ